MWSTMVQRKEYLDWLIRWREQQLIKVVTGVRRCGKSTLLSLFMDYLRQTGVAEEQIISINLEDIDNEHLLNYQVLHTYVKDRLCKDSFTYVFIDEVQKCPQFEKAVDSLFIRNNVDIYITGSNAHILSSELATLLSGRYVEIRMLPLSFAEYLEFAKDKNDLKRSDIVSEFTDYLQFGSFPYVATLQKDKAAIRDYIESIYNTILIKDVARRKGINDVPVLESIVRFLCSCIGSPISANRISDAINSSGRRISVNTVEGYLRALTDSYIFYKVDRFDIRGKQFLKTLGKYYIVDTGLRNMLVGSGSIELGHLLENVVYLELIRRGYRVNIGKLAEKEVDFIAEDSLEMAYYQVSASTLDENTLRRELEPLQRISDNHPKLLLTLDDYLPNANYDGVIKKNVLDWLLEK